MAHWHDLPPLPNDTSRRAHVDDRAIQASARLLDAPCHEEDAGLSRDAFEFLPRAIATLVGGLRLAVLGMVLGDGAHGVGAQFPADPGAPGAGTVAHRVSEVHGPLEVAEILLAAPRCPPADDAAKCRPAGVPAEVGLREEQEVDLLCCRAAGELLQVLQGLPGGGLCAGRGGPQPDRCGCHAALGVSEALRANERGVRQVRWVSWHQQPRHGRREAITHNKVTRHGSLEISAG